ncbi:MAG: right-handed parallel beta-helix repeat-containing protein, partial [Bacteroidetes bacterium]
MKRILNFLALSLFLQVNVSATIYYVSNSGKDDHTGLSAEWPLQTLNRAAELALPGDAILLKRGDIFRESVTFGTIHIRIGAYGPADEPLPVISGAIPVEGFMPFRDGIYRARVSITPGYLFVDGKLMTIARYPNEGWLRTKYWEDTRIPRDATSEQLAKPNTMVECAELQNYSMNKDDFWIGAKIRWRHHSWWYETRDVVDYESSGKLYLSDRSFGVQNPRPGMSKGWGFYLDNKLELLDSPGEWYFDREQGFVYLFPPEGMQLGKVLVETSVRDTGISITDGMIQHISFRHQKDIGLRIKGSCVVQYCEFEGIGRDAAVSEGLAGGAAIRAETETRDTRISHNLFRNNLNNAIAWWQDRRDSTSSVIERNIVENSGTVPGYGGSGSWHGVAILIGTGRNVQVQYNRVEKSGYAGILFGTEGNAAEYNVIHHAMSTMNDGGGIYTNCSHSIIRYNIITDTRGGMESSGSWATIAHGIWPEFLGEYRNNVIEFNTVSGSGGDGIFLPNNFESIVRKNVCYNNDRFQLLIIGRGDQVVNVHQEHLVSENILYAASPGQNAFYFD